MDHVQQQAGLPPVNGYSHAVAFEGTMLAVSGQVPVNAAGELVGAGDPEQQIRQVFTNLGAVLAAAGSDFSRVVKITVFLTDLDDLLVFRKVRDEFLDTAAPPASSLVQVAGLVHPEFRVEIEAIAITESGRSADPN